MKLIASITISAALVSLAACGQSAAAPSAMTGSPAADATHAAAPLTCKQQSDRWKARNKVILRKFKNAVVPFSKGTVTSAEAHALSADAQAAEDVPPPACADPKGYYTQALADMVTAGDAASGGGMLSEVGAMTPMENALTALSELTAELHQTIKSGTI